MAEKIINIYMYIMGGKKRKKINPNNTKSPKNKRDAKKKRGKK